jgi:hypothetical protein
MYHLEFIEKQLIDNAIHECVGILASHRRDILFDLLLPVMLQQEPSESLLQNEIVNHSGSNVTSVYQGRVWGLLHAFKPTLRQYKIIDHPIRNNLLKSESLEDPNIVFAIKQEAYNEFWNFIQRQYPEVSMRLKTEISQKSAELLGKQLAISYRHIILENSSFLSSLVSFIMKHIDDMT